MKIKFFKFKYTHLLASLRAVTVIIIIVIAVTLVGVGFFLYTYFYQTISQSQEIIILKKEVSPESIDIVQVQKTITNIEKKGLTAELPKSYRNPFSFGVASSTSE